MAGTITGTTITSTYTLTANPTTIASNGAVEVNSATAQTAAIVGPSGTAWTLTNLGTVESVGNLGLGITLASGGLITNGASDVTSALIMASYQAINVNGGAGTVINYGTIEGTQTGVSLAPTGSSVTVNNYGLVGGATGIVDSAPPPSGYYTPFGDSIVNHGWIAGTTGAGIVLGGVTARIDNFGTIGGANGTAVAFGSGHGTVVIEPGAMFTGVLGGLAQSDIIDFAHVSASGFGFVGGVLTLFNHGTVVPGATIGLTGTFAPSDLTLVSDHNGGVEVSIGPVCFCLGTLILTEHGEVPVEELAVGDRVRTLSGACKPIVWIGMGRELVTRANKLTRPIIVRTSALADGVPARDLHLTHGHALYLEGVLIPVENLINHRSILWDETARVVEFYHIELEDHDVVLANGAPAETYYDANNRALFHNTRPESVPGAAEPTFAPVLSGGELVDRVWFALYDRAGGYVAADTTDDPDLHLLVDGARLDAMHVDSDTHSFALDGPPAGTLRLCSRSAVPSLLRITVHDHRRLGVAIGRIVIAQSGTTTVIGHDAPLLLAGGCHPAENGYAWTDGDLELPERLFADLNGSITLSVHVERPGMRYPSHTAATASAASSVASRVTSA